MNLRTDDHITVYYPERMARIHMTKGGVTSVQQTGGGGTEHRVQTEEGYGGGGNLTFAYLEAAPVGWRPDAMQDGQ